ARSRPRSMSATMTRAIWRNLGVRGSSISCTASCHVPMTGGGGYSKSGPSQPRRSPVSAGRRVHDSLPSDLGDRRSGRRLHGGRGREGGEAVESAASALGAGRPERLQAGTRLVVYGVTDDDQVIFQDGGAVYAAALHPGAERSLVAEVATQPIVLISGRVAFV